MDFDEWHEWTEEMPSNDPDYDNGPIVHYRVNLDGEVQYRMNTNARWTDISPKVTAASRRLASVLAKMEK